MHRAVSESSRRIAAAFADWGIPTAESIRLVRRAIPEATLIASGGIAAADHVPKAMVCGADAVAVDLVLQVALGCALWADVRFPCPVEDEEVDPEWGTQRIVNLMGAWHGQLIELLGAMGLREVLRLNRAIDQLVTYTSVGHTDALFFALFQGSGVPERLSDDVRYELRTQLGAIRRAFDELEGAVP